MPHGGPRQAARGNTGVPARPPPAATSPYDPSLRAPTGAASGPTARRAARVRAHPRRSLSGPSRAILAQRFWHSDHCKAEALAALKIMRTSPRGNSPAEASRAAQRPVRAPTSCVRAPGTPSLPRRRGGALSPAPARRSRGPAVGRAGRGVKPSQGKAFRCYCWGRAGAPRRPVMC